MESVALRPTALQAARDKILILARHSGISDEIARKLAREIDSPAAAVVF